MDKGYYREYAALEDTHWWFRGRRAIVRSVLKRWLKKGQSPRILDVGCGTGGMLSLLQRFGRVEGLECAPEALEHCHIRFGDKITVHQGSLPDGLPRDELFDVVTAFDVIEHIEDAVAALQAIRGALTPMGTLVCTVPAFKFLWGPHDEINHHCRRYTRALLVKHLNEAGYKVSWASYFNIFLFPPIAAIRLLHKVMPARRTNESDFSESPRFVNQFLTGLFASERFLLPFIPLPFGVSLIVIAKPKLEAEKAP